MKLLKNTPFRTCSIDLKRKANKAREVTSTGGQIPLKTLKGEGKLTQFSTEVAIVTMNLSISQGLRVKLSK
jgi:hypothetical protein